jgi:hypothetical protein
MTHTATTAAKLYMNRAELHEDWKVVRDIVQYLCSAMEQLNTADADGSPLPSDLSSSKSAYGFAQQALREVVLAQFGFDLSTVDVNWGGEGGGWAYDVKELLVRELVGI